MTSLSLVTPFWFEVGTVAADVVGLLEPEPFRFEVGKLAEFVVLEIPFRFEVGKLVESVVLENPETAQLGATKATKGPSSAVSSVVRNVPAAPLPQDLVAPAAAQVNAVL